MTAPLRQQQLRLDPLEVFRARAEARATLYEAGELSLHDAVDELQALAERDGLIERIGQDEVQRIMSEAFAAVRDDLPCADDAIDDDAWSIRGWHEAVLEYQKDRGSRVSVVSYSDEELARLRRLMADTVSLERAWHELSERAPRDVPTATLYAAEYLAQQKDLHPLKEWLTRHSREERQAIRNHLSKRGPSCAQG